MERPAREEILISSHAQGVLALSNAL
jgi:hypothetical protein